jgi:hypothetical protein
MLAAATLFLTGAAQAYGIKDCLRDIGNDEECRIWEKIEKTKRRMERKEISALPVRQQAKAPPLEQSSPPVIGNKFYPTVQRIATRADFLDEFYYGVQGFGAGGGSGSAYAKGASFNFTGNLYSLNATAKQITVSHPLSANASGIVSYTLFPTIQEIGPFQVMPLVFVYGSGNWDRPSKATDYSFVKSGVDLQALYQTGNSSLPGVLLDVSPYGQTDFFGIARADGVRISVSPQIPSISLNSGFRDNPFFGWIVWSEGVADINNVTKPGFTLLNSHTYAWLGGKVRAYAFPFRTPGDPAEAIDWPSLIRDRLTLIGTAETYDDARSRARATYYSAEVQYNLAGCKTSGRSVAAPAEPCYNEGSTAISFEYDWGTQKETLVYSRKYLGKLSYKY